MKFKDGLLVNKVGDRCWYKHNLLHRKYKQAIIYANGISKWYYYGFNNKCKENLYINSLGDKFWYKNDLYHRVNRYAIIFFTGQTEWYNHGQLHRLDGPAYGWEPPSWYYYDEHIDCSSQEEFERLIKLRLLW